MTSQHLVRTHDPLPGRVAFARVAAVGLQQAGTAQPESQVARGHRRLDLSEDPAPPGEGRA